MKNTHFEHFTAGRVKEGVFLKEFTPVASHSAVCAVLCCAVQFCAVMCYVLCCAMCCVCCVLQRGRRREEGGVEVCKKNKHPALRMWGKINIMYFRELEVFWVIY